MSGPCSMSILPILLPCSWSGRTLTLKWHLAVVSGPWANLRHRRGPQYQVTALENQRTEMYIIIMFYMKSCALIILSMKDRYTMMKIHNSLEMKGLILSQSTCTVCNVLIKICHVTYIYVSNVCSALYYLILLYSWFLISQR